MISCLTVTRWRPALLARAMACFDRQTHLARELVIVADADDVATLDYLHAINRPDVQVIVAPAGQTLGDLRNLAVDAAKGTCVAQWDDDDFYHAHRLQAQLQRIETAHKPACCLARWLLYKDGKALISQYRAWEGSILCEKSQMPPYPSLRRGEDTPVIEALSTTGKLCLLDRPGLYVYQFHGQNTWNEDHFNTMLKWSTGAATPEQFPILEEIAHFSDTSRT